MDSTRKKSKLRSKQTSTYVPSSLTVRDRRAQSRMLARSRRLYREGVYYTRKPVRSFRSRPSGHIGRARRMYGVDTIGASAELAGRTGCTKTALARIVKKGEGAYYSSGSRPNQTPQSWGLARLASAITSGRAAAVDFHILERGCRPASRALRLAEAARRKYGRKGKKKPKK